MPDRFRTWFRTRVRVPFAVVTAVLAFGGLAAAWSVATPLAEAPDEPAHLGLVLHLAAGEGYPSYDGLRSPASAFRLCATYAAATRACPRPGEPITPTSTRRHPVADAPDKHVRPAWDDAGGAERIGAANQMPQHPPLYYQAMATVLRVERAVLGHPWSLDRELALLRLVNVALVAPIPLLAWWAARRAGFDDATGTTAAVATLGLPMLAHIGSTVNNDNLLTLCGAVVAALLAGVLRGDRSWRTAVAVGLVTALAILTKASAFLFLPAVALAYVVGGWGRLREFVRPALVAGGSALLLGAWWYVDVRARTGRWLPSTEEEKLGSDLRPPGFHASLADYLPRYARDLDQRFWGSFGWYTVRLSTGLTWLLTFLVVAAVAIALVRGVRTARDRVVLASLLAPLALLKLFVLQHAWSIHVRTSTFQFIQGRYLFPAVVGLAVVVAVGVVHVAGRWAAAAVGCAAVVLQGWSLHRALEGWWGGPGVGPRGQVRALVAWSGWPGELVGLVLLAAGAAVVALLAALVVPLVRPQPAVGSSDP